MAATPEIAEMAATRIPHPLQAATPEIAKMAAVRICHPLHATPEIAEMAATKICHPLGAATPEIAEMSFHSDTLTKTMNSNFDNTVLHQDHAKCRLKAVRRKFPNFKLCSPQLARRKQDNASAVNVRAVIGALLEAAIDDSLEAAINDSLEVAIDDSLEVVIGTSLDAAIDEISPSGELPILPSDELPIKNNKLKNRNSQIKYRERKKKKDA